MSFRLKYRPYVSKFKIKGARLRKNISENAISILKNCDGIFFMINPGRQLTIFVFEKILKVHLT